CRRPGFRPGRRPASRGRGPKGFGLGTGRSRGPAGPGEGLPGVTPVSAPDATGRAPPRPASPARPAATRLPGTSALPRRRGSRLSLVEPDRRSAGELPLVHRLVHLVGRGPV